MQRAATVIDDVEIAVDRIIERVGKRIVLGIPLGLGKPVELTNALYRRAQADPDLKLKIFTALSLAKPVASSDVEREFMENGRASCRDRVCLYVRISEVAEVSTKKERGHQRDIDK